MSTGCRRGVILDRDGVLVIPEFRCGRSFAPRRLEDFRLYPDAAGSVRALKAAGFVVIVATNQPDVGAGLMERAVLEEMHHRLRAEAPVDDIEVCTETRAQATDRRKPGPGMLLDAARIWRLDPGVSYAVGDRATDVEAACRAGFIPVFIDRGYTAEPQPTRHAATVYSLGEATDWILSRESNAA